MNFLYQIVTSSYVYTLYDEDTHFLLHVLNLKNEESTDICTINEILDVLHEDTEVSFDDIIGVEDVITTVLISEE